MSKDFIPTDSKKIFVGRENELALFNEILCGTRPEWIVHIPGPGGVGKTCLLEQMQRIVREQNFLMTQSMIDFYKPSNHAFFGFLLDLVLGIGREYRHLFEEFQDQLSSFRHLLGTEPDPIERTDAVERVTDAFFEGYKQLLLLNKPIVLFLDTCEEMLGMETWLTNTFLPKVAELEEARVLMSEGDIDTNAKEGGTYGLPTSSDQSLTVTSLTKVVVAGRKTLATLVERFGEHVAIMRLSPLTLQETKNYFVIGGASVKLLNGDNIHRLHELTEGRPLYVALTYDWLKNEVGTSEELLEIERPFSEKLINWLLRLETLENRAILYTAMAWRRMEPSLLAMLLQVSLEEAQKVISELSRFSFTKYQPAEGGFVGRFQLHDEFRELVLQYTWPRVGLMTKNDLLYQVIEWYEQRVGNELLLKGKVLPNSDEERSLLVEWLFYSCQLNLQEGFSHYDRLFRHAMHYQDLAFCEMLHQQIGSFDKTLSDKQRDERRFQEALLAMRREKYHDADVIWSSLIRRPWLDKQLKATCLQQLVELYSYTGKQAEAIEKAQEAEKLYQELIEAEKDPDKRMRLEAELGQTYNNWGYVHRQRWELEEAIKYYNQALDRPARKKSVAKTMNNLGYVYFLKGDITEAKTLIGRSLETRRQLQIPSELGFGYNTMGIVMEQSDRFDHAVDLYRKAHEYMVIANNERGQAMVLVKRGHIDRLMNAYDQALENLSIAEKLFRRGRNTEALIEAWNEIGCVYRHRWSAGDWERAESYFQQSLKLSEDLNVLFQQADNWEDLSILYLKWMRHIKEDRIQGEYQVYLEMTANAARKAQSLAKRVPGTNGVYLNAKAIRTFGELAFEQGEYDTAFDNYLHACQTMADAVALTEQGQGSTIGMRRRFEEMVDRLQEQLHKLPDPLEEERQAQRLLQLISEDEKSRLALLVDYLKATIQLTPRGAVILD